MDVLYILLFLVFLKARSVISNINNGQRFCLEAFLPQGAERREFLIGQPPMAGPVEKVRSCGRRLILLLRNVDIHLHQPAAAILSHSRTDLIN